VLNLPGRSMRILVDRETMDARNLSMGVIEIPVSGEVRPCHSHPDSEEVVYILCGEGEAWIDGETYSFSAGDAIFFPMNSKHMVRNTGLSKLRMIFVFSPPTSPERYQFYEDIDCS
jgi:quercetin dioxygenase-like cupin family protein